MTNEQFNVNPDAASNNSLTVDEDIRLAFYGIGKDVINLFSNLSSYAIDDIKDFQKVSEHVAKSIQEIKETAHDIEALIANKAASGAVNEQAVKDFRENHNKRLGSEIDRLTDKTEETAQNKKFLSELEKAGIPAQVSNKLGYLGWAIDAYEISDAWNKSEETGNYELLGEKVAEIMGQHTAELGTSLLGTLLLKQLAKKGLMKLGLAALCGAIGLPAAIIAAGWEGAKIGKWIYNKWIKDIDRDGEYNIYDPFLLDLNGYGVKTIGHDGFNKAIFDHNGNGLKTATGWVDANDGILVRDLDGDGKITRGAEMFGDQTLLADSVSKAIHGLAALADLDSNKDGKISAEDETFDELQVWVDANSNGEVDEGELKSLEELEIAEINLDCQKVDQQLGAGNRLTHTGTYTKTDGTTGKTGDVNFALDTLHTQFTDTIALNDEQAARPNIAGSGNLRELNQAAALSESLAQVLDAYTNLNTKQEQITMLDSLLVEWAKTDENFGGFGTISFSTFF